MIRGLITKEIRALTPFALLIAGFLGLIVVSMMTDFPDKHTLAASEWLAEDRSGSLAAILLFGLMLGSGLLVNESDQGTLSFLDGLPVSRTRIFFAKIVAAILVLSLVPILGLTIDVTLGLISRTSTDGPFPWSFVWLQGALQFVVIIYVIAAATAFSFLRRWFALVVGLVFWGYLWLQQADFAWATYLDPNETLNCIPGDHGLQVPWKHLGVQLAASAGFFAAGWAGFHLLGDRTTYALGRAQENRFLRGLGATIRWLAPIVWIVVIASFMSDSTPDTPDEDLTPLGESAFSRRESDAYEFLYRSSQVAEANALIRVADEVHAKVAAFFSAEPLPSRIVVDLASPVIPHAVGQTNWTKIRIPFTDGDDLDELKLILGHETAHVYIDQLSNSRAAKVFRYARFLHEGLATYVDQEFFTSEEKRLDQRHAVALALARGKIPFETLCDDTALDQVRDRNLVYPVGELFVRALIKTHGPDSPARLLRALGRDHVPMGLKGTALWRDTMQAAGLDLDRVVAAYDAKCSELQETEAAFIKRYPRLKATVELVDDSIVIRPQFEGEAPGRMIATLRVNDTLGNDLRILPPREDGTFHFPRSAHPQDTVRYMVGWIVNGRDAVFEPWTSTQLP